MNCRHCGCCQCPCKYDPIVMPMKECVCNRCFYVEQPVICPCNTRVVNHYIPKPVYYYTYSQTEESMCHGNPSTQTPKDFNFNPENK